MLSVLTKRNHEMLSTIIFTTVALLVTVATIIAWWRPVLWRFLYRVSLLYSSIFVASVLSCVGALATYFSNEGCIFAMNSFNFLCSFWIDVTVEVRNLERINQISGPEQNPLVIISNHQSALDLFVLSEFWPAKCTAMMKKSLKYVPFFNIGATLSNAIFVDRRSKEGAKHALDESIETMRQKKLKVWIFPEGTRNREHGILPFKKGAFNVAVRAHFPIVPVVISDYSPFYSHPGHYFKPSGHVIVQVMEPVSTENMNNDDVPRLCERIHSQMTEIYERISNEAMESMSALN